MKTHVLTGSSVDLAKHHCEMAVIGCVDFRFRKDEQRFVEEILGIQDFDYLKLPGGGKNFTDLAGWRDACISAIRSVCVDLHQVKRILVLNHWDCGAYGFSRSFGSEAEEARRYVRDLTAAAKYLREQFPSLTIDVGYSRADRESTELTFNILDGADFAEAAQMD